MSIQTPVVPGAEAKRVSRSWQAVAQAIDHTVLKPDATRQQIVQLCEEAARYKFASACVNQCWVALAASILRGTAVKVDTVAGFPLGANLTTVKRYETAELMRLGAGEIDMVLNLGALKSGDRTLVQADIAGVTEVAHDGGAMVKVILETGLLTLDEKIIACELSVAAQADFVKTATGFGSGGATVEDVALMRGVVGQRAGVKASGGIRTAANALAMLDAGADRLGTSSAITILRELGAPTQP